MNISFKVLSHACLLIKTENTSIVIDPWLLGSCYWRSWWNFPKAKYNEEELQNVDAVIISHVHWDHWHGPTLKKFFKDKTIIIPDEPGLRSRKDLRSLRFNSTQIKHGHTIELGDLKITMYQFGLYFTDAAIVIEAYDKVILNANDAKIAGFPLKKILKKHGKIDFAFRSHSSANPRTCYQIEGQDSFEFDDKDHYARSFMLFMDAIEPAYAIPFASNHCHLHKDVFEYNSYISDPIELQKYIQKHPKKGSWKLKVMMPGSAWSKENGFHLIEPKEFIDKTNSLENYKSEVQNKLNTYYEKEMNIDIDDKTWAKFMEMLKTPFYKKDLGNFLISVTRPDGSGITKRISKQELIEVPFTLNSNENEPLIIIPGIVFKDAVRKNMFEHAGISKRCKYLAKNEKDMQSLTRIVGLLERRERLPIDLPLVQLLRFPATYIRRWRELLVYFQALYYKYYRKLPLYLIEEKILSKT